MSFHEIMAVEERGFQWTMFIIEPTEVYQPMLNSFKGRREAWCWTKSRHKANSGSHW